MVQVQEPEYEELYGPERMRYQTQEMKFYRDVQHIIDLQCPTHKKLLEPNNYGYIMYEAMIPMQIERRLRLAANIGTTELLKVRLPGERLVGVSLDYILQEQASRGVVDLTGERSFVPDA